VWLFAEDVPELAEVLGSKDGKVCDEKTRYRAYCRGE
jgi:hypothetical protein